MKNTIKKNFNRATSTYNEVDDIQKKSSSILIENFNSFSENFIPNKILDIGCGTGNLTDILLKYFINSTYYLNDISESMLNFTKNKYKKYHNFYYELDDIESIKLSNDYDLIASNLCLQWVCDLEKCIKKLFNQSKFLAISILLEETFSSWSKVLEKYDIHGAIKKYPSIDYIKKIINKLNPEKYHISTKSFNINFENNVSIMKYLQKLGANTAHYNKRNNIKNIKNLISDKSSCILNYNIAYLVIKK
ncbi:MAG: methyltransferase [Anaplasmataceae bacterium]|nr:methyltransferase [Anaplasmataceae bacterium]